MGEPSPPPDIGIFPFVPHWTFFSSFKLILERERDMDLLLHVFTHALVDACRCPDRGSNLRPWRIGRML